MERLRSMGKRIWWCIWGAGSFLWCIFLIQYTAAKNETEILAGNENEIVDTVFDQEVVSDSTEGYGRLQKTEITKNEAKKEVSEDKPCVNVNTADGDGLVSLQGIGPVLAERIISFRQKNGNFTGASDLIKVKGIGEVKLKKISDYICF